MPAGAYVAAAVEDLDLDNMHEPEVVDALRRLGQTFRASDGETVNLAQTLAALP